MCIVCVCMRVYISLYNIQEKYILSSEFISENSSLNRKYKHIKGNSNPYQIQFFIFPTPGYFHWTFLMAAYVIPRVLHSPSHLNCWIWDNVQDEDYVGWWSMSWRFLWENEENCWVTSRGCCEIKMNYKSLWFFAFSLFTMNFFLFIFSSSLCFVLDKKKKMKKSTQENEKN